MGPQGDGTQGLSFGFGLATGVSTFKGNLQLKKQIKINYIMHQLHTRESKCFTHALTFN